MTFAGGHEQSEYNTFQCDASVCASRRNLQDPIISMKKTTKENLKIAAWALGSIPVLFGIVLLVQWAGVEKWFDLAWWTGAVFGFAAARYGKGLKRIGPICVFVGALLLHLALTIAYLRSGRPFPSLLLGIVVATLEATAVITLLRLVGGPPSRHVRETGRREDEDSL